MSDPQISVRGVSVRFGSHVALHDVDLDVSAGEVAVLLGRSGSGKTTLLRAVAGFTHPSEGRVYLDGRDVTLAPPHARGLGMVVQNYALFPHMRVADNVAFGLQARRRSRREIDETVPHFLEMVGMSAFAQRFPRELSGGQQQRVAIARALAIRPHVLLLDEPLSALDAPLRAEMLEELRGLHAKLPEMSIVYVTHDQTEAISLGHRIVLMRDGRIAAEGSPRSLHDEPPNRYAAEFFGQANLLPAAIEPGDAHGRLVRVCVARQVVRATRTAASPAAGNALLCIRPHDLRAAAGGGHGGDDNRLSGRVHSVRWLGATQRVTLGIDDVSIRVDLPGNVEAPRPGDPLSLSFDPERAVLLADT